MESVNPPPGNNENGDDYKPSREGEELAKAFEAGINWLASQRDPYRVFQQHLAAGYIITSGQKQEANRQFEEIARTGKIDATRMFDIMEGLHIRRISPDTFFSTLQAYTARKRAEEMERIAEKEAKKKNQRESFEKFMGADFLKNLEPKNQNNSKHNHNSGLPESKRNEPIKLKLPRKFQLGKNGQIEPVFEGDLKDFAEELLKKFQKKDKENEDK